ncbi:SGNH/GDSL hydrolase family protein [Colwellia piezophila]|uniref:SGNH/GDSL hydrolase family protein n=1 Tax=Colwellia piezophila TaxID=211668 RepID=UPI00037F9000|nr:GDSL-type esterase/lipase family protein [Colwellia piezophila]
MVDIVMIGSSIFEFWQQPHWPPLSVSNQAVRGSQSQYWRDSDLNTLPQAKSYLVYCGSNDLIYGVSPRQTIENIKALLTQLTRLQPSAKIGYFSIMKCPQKEDAGQLDIIDEINHQIKDFINDSNSSHNSNHKYSNLDYFNFNHYIANHEKWFVEDGLHLTDNAYQRLDQQLTPVLSLWLGSDK